ncbi:MAG: response regulator [bacterium]
MNSECEKKVLIVDDEKSICQIIARVVRHEGLEAKSAEDAKHAQRLLRKERFGLVFSDLRMPGEMDGSHLIRWIKTNFPELPVVVVSSYADVDEETMRDSETHSNRVVLKPFQISEIASLIHDYTKA